MATGIIKWFNENKDLGCIAPDDDSKDVFVHISAIVNHRSGSLAGGLKLTYETRLRIS
jgi:CspA family cold shock protein